MMWFLLACISLAAVLMVMLLYKDKELDRLSDSLYFANKQLEASKAIIKDLTTECESLTQERDLYRDAYRSAEKKLKGSNNDI